MNKVFKYLSFALLLLPIISIPPKEKVDYLNPNLSVEKRVDNLLNKMTLDEKIGQMMQVDITGLQENPQDITNYFFGSILSGGDSDPIDNKPESWAALHDSLQNYALKTRLKIPIIYGIDAVHGNNNVYGATIFPHNIGLGCTRNPELIKMAAEVTAQEVAATGIKWTFAPCVAVPRDERWGRTYEGFGETPELAEIMGTAQVRGFQRNNFDIQTTILACAKHYLGDGGTVNGIDRGNTIGNESDIRKIHLAGYISAINAGVKSIMVSYNSVNDNPMTANKFWITDVLKDELSFDGIVVTDWGAVDLLGENYKDDVEKAVNAGIDMVMLPTRYKDFYIAMRSLIKENKISLERIDDAVKRILKAKFEIGIFEHPFSDESLISKIGSEEHRNIARQCVRESIVLLKRKNGILPLPKNSSRILVAGSHADNLGYQCGGWTITWQGNSGNITKGTTILQAIKKASINNEIEFSELGDFQNTKADYSIVVIGEKPYAEGYGDTSNLNLSNSDIELIKKIKSYGNPVIVILISGRPLIIKDILNYTDVLFAAWLPGTEGEGITDILFGDFKPTGKLSHSWPKNMDQIPINFGDKNYDPLFEYGYGITTF